jgi:hypothetical protein
MLRPKWSSPTKVTRHRWIILGGRVYQNEFLVGRDSCRHRDEAAAEAQPTDVGFVLKRLFIIPRNPANNPASGVEITNRGIAKYCTRPGETRRTSL